MHSVSAVVILYLSLETAVASKKSSEVFLEGTLERGIIPDESVWVAGQGEGEDGFMLFLQKMNLELLQKCGMLLGGFAIPAPSPFPIYFLIHFVTLEGFWGCL
jgi:hypothetical protein